MAAAVLHPVIQLLLAEQQAVHTGLPGGLGQAQTPEERAEALKFPEKNKPKDFKDPCAVAPDHSDAHDLMAVHINRLISRLIASKYFYKEYEQLALDWLEDQLKMRAAVQFRLALKEAKRVATTSGIGPNSVLYRTFRDMLLAYPAHGVKASIMRRRAAELVWSPTKTVGEIHSAWMAYCETYDHAAALTQPLADVTLAVPAQDWATLFTEMQGVFPSCVTTLIINHPDRFTMLAPIVGAGMELGAATSLAQMAVPVPGTTTQATLIMGGAQPEGYVYVGLNQGLSVWGHTDIVTASVTDGNEAGNV